MTWLKGKSKEEGARQPKPKKLKDSAPKSLAGKKFLRYGVRIGVLLLVLKGAIAYAQGTKIIENHITVGDTKPSIDDSVKGFAVDFATDYFTWNISNLPDRQNRLKKFITKIDMDAGLRSSELRGNSRVLDAAVYAANKVDDKHVDVTIQVRREVTLAPAPGQKASDAAPLIEKLYFVIPVSVSKSGPVIESYPRFIGETLKGDSVADPQQGIETDEGLLKKANDLTISFFKSWNDGDATQLKYFYADGVKPPEQLPKTNFVLDKVDRLEMFKLGGAESNNYQIETNFTVKNSLNEIFMNSWVLQVTLKDGRLYVKSVGPNTAQGNQNKLPSRALPYSPNPTQPKP